MMFLKSKKTMSQKIAQQIKARRELLKLVGRPPRRKKKLPKRRMQTGATLKYFRAIKNQLAQLQKAVEDILYPALPHIVTRARVERDVRLDTSVDLIVRVFKQLALVFGVGFETDFLTATAREVNIKNREDTQAQFKALLGVELLQAEQRLGPTLESFILENVSLVKSIPEELLPDLQSTVLRSVRQGKLVDEIKREIQKRFKVKENKALFLAVDQVNKLNGQLTEQRHRNVGIEEYYWDDSGDDKVRPRHRALAVRSEEGETFRYDDPPEVAPGRYANPGQDYRCRCNALPVLPADLLEAVGDDRPPKKVTLDAM